MENPNENEIIDYSLNYFNIDSFKECPIEEIIQKFNISEDNRTFVNNCIKKAEFKGLIKFSGNTKFSAKLTDLGLSIVESGGWLKHIEIEQEKVKFQISRDKIELENLKTNTEINKWLIKTKWFPHIISLISIITTIIFGIITLKSDSESDKLKEKLQKIEVKLDSLKLKK